MRYNLGIDIGSTTAKAVLTDENKNILFSAYERHYSKVREKCIEFLKKAEEIALGEPIGFAVSGSAGLGISEAMHVPFIQEVIAEGEVVKCCAPDTSCIIELGGEDAKIIFLEGGADERMNGTCAGGTGAFIDQMATLLDVTPEELDLLSLKYEKIYPVASRCGVFAKTDIQPLINQGARKEDIAKSIFQAVVNQTIAGLAQGRTIKGKVMFLGGPLYFFSGLRDSFKQTLSLSDDDIIFPDYARISVALGAAYYAQSLGYTFNIKELISLAAKARRETNARALPPLFENDKAYAEFKERHKKAHVPAKDISFYSGAAYLGIDCGSTTTKLVLISENKDILYSHYCSNKGNPVFVVYECLKEIYDLCADRIRIRGSAVTGYGEDLIKNAFSADYGIVETIAHYTAAKHFKSDVNFILDIGGQDIKCFKIHNGAIDSIMLNEACSSGCGSFLETFARSMGCSIEEFAKKGLNAKAPVNLGSRCTVFMNSSVKQAQKEGATLEDISAGLSVSVVKNALYKVIRASSPDELGENIVVQGGTFYNDAVLRAFENELGREVIRPDISGLMGAYGAAIYSMRATFSSIITPERLKTFSHKSSNTVCNGCTNHCHLTVNIFDNGKKLISGNQCQKGAGADSGSELPNLYEYKRNALTKLCGGENKRGRIGIPLALGIYELLPLWDAVFKSLGFETVLSPMSSRALYEKGQFSIPSDTACYPAKLMHGHIAYLLEAGVDAVFYPCLTYNLDERISDNHYNCPVVAYYSELLKGNVDDLKSTVFLYPYLNINSKRALAKELYKYLNEKLGTFSYREIYRAVKNGFDALFSYRQSIMREGRAAIDYARENGKSIMVLAGRPYHADSQICHGIDKIANSLGFVVISEDCLPRRRAENVRVLNQWTYHARLYSAAETVAENSDMELVQLVSFGCGVDAITTDEVRSVLESRGKLYTQIKIDEITNPGAVRIRLRSLLGAMEERRNAD